MGLIALDSWLIFSFLYRDRLAEGEKNQEMKVDLQVKRIFCNLPIILCANCHIFVQQKKTFLLKNQVMCEKVAVERFYEQNSEVRQAQVKSKTAIDGFKIEHTREYPIQTTW